MNKKIKVLSKLNFISYLFMVILATILTNDLFTKLNNITKFIIGIIPYILIMCTSFILASDRFVEFKSIKIEAIIDWVIRIIAFGVIINYSKHFSNVFLPLIFIVFACILNIIIEYRINKKLMNVKEERVNDDKIEITYEEKCNLKSIVKAVNSGMSLILIFGAVSLSVPVIVNMEGTLATMRYISVILSIVVFILFTITSYYNYTDFYLDKEKAKKLYARDIIVASIGYIVCLISAFIKMNHEVYSYISFTGILFLLPMINTIRKMSRRLTEIRNSIDKETFRNFYMKKK